MYKLFFRFCFYNSNHFSPGQKKADSLLLANYRPVSIYKIPTANITRAAFPIIDMHSHDYVSTPAEVDEWVKTMDRLNIQKTMILCTRAD